MVCAISQRIVRFLVCLMLIASMGTQACASDEMNGHFLLKLIESARYEPGLDTAFVALVVGFVQGQRTAWMANRVEPDCCIPDDADFGDITNAVRRFAEHGAIYGFSSASAHEFLNLEAITIVWLGVATHYPCDHDS